MKNSKRLIVFTSIQLAFCIASIYGAEKPELLKIPRALGIAEKDSEWHLSYEKHANSPKGKRPRSGCNNCLAGSVICQSCNEKNYLNKKLVSIGLTFLCVRCGKELCLAPDSASASPLEQPRKFSDPRGLED
jgi:hypothetical protein